MNSKTNIRQSNFELMRIISMFLIVMWHYISHTNLLYRTSGLLNLAINFIYITTSIHVNSFILVSGYFQYNKNFKFNKILSLINATWFYKSIYALFFLFTGIITFSKFDLFLFLQPLNFSYSYGEFYWFINMYIFLYLLTPYINRLIENLTQAKHRRLIITLFIMSSLLPHLALQNTLTNTGYTICHFVTLYIIGAYFGKYKLKDNYHFKNYSHNKYQLIIIFLLLISIISSFLVKPISEYFNKYNSTLLNYLSNVLGNNTINFSSPLIVIESILYLLFFETLNFKNKFINKLSSLTFGIYLVHENKLLFLNLYQHLPIGIQGNVYSYKVILEL